MSPSSRPPSRRPKPKAPARPKASSEKSRPAPEISPLLENRPFGELETGDHASLTRTFTPEDLETFAGGTEERAEEARDGGTGEDPQDRIPLAAGVWLESLVATALATRLPGPGTRLHRLDLRFPMPLLVGDTVGVSLTVRAVESDPHGPPRARLECRIANQRNETVAEGGAWIFVPTRKIRRPSVPRSAGGRPAPGTRLRALVDEARAARLRAKRDPLRTAVVHPVDAPALGGAVDAARAGLITPVFVGPRARILAAAKSARIDLRPYEIVPTEHSHAAAERAVALARDGEVEALMKGSLHTDELMHAVLDPARGLRTDRRTSHVFLVDAPHWPRLLLLTDAAINVSPDLAAKRDIVQNAIELAHVLGIARPRVALLSSLETVTPTIPSTLEAAALCKMAERGQILRGVLDGPLAFDNAASSRAARTKGISSPVAGRADILVVPDLDAGNMLAKGLEYLGGARLAGLVLGTRIPVILTSRADLEEARMASCAVALLQVLAPRTKGAEGT